MLNILRERLLDGMEIQKAKEKPSKYEITFVVYGKEYKNEIPKTCAPGAQNYFVDTAMYSVMCAAEMDRCDLNAAKVWLDKITHHSNE